MTEGLRLVCPCGALVDGPLPAAGRPPAPCGACGAPLVAPGGVGRSALETGTAAAVLAAVVCAFAWVGLARAFDGAVHAAIPAGALVIAWSVRRGAKVRAPQLQWIAGAATLAFLALGELLLYRHALLGRLVAMHAAEQVAGGGTDSAVLAEDEYRAMTPGKYLHIELDLAWWAAVALGAFIVGRTLRPLPSVPAFVVPEATPPLVATEAVTEVPPADRGDAAPAPVADTAGG